MNRINSKEHSISIRYPLDVLFNKYNKFLEIIELYHDKNNDQLLEIFKLECDNDQIYDDVVYDLSVYKMEKDYHEKTTDCCDYSDDANYGSYNESKVLYFYYPFTIRNDKIFTMQYIYIFKNDNENDDDDDDYDENRNELTEFRINDRHFISELNVNGVKYIFTPDDKLIYKV